MSANPATRRSDSFHASTTLIGFVRRFLLGAVLLLAALSVAEARMVRFEITAREPLAGGARFGAVGAYEKLRGTAFFEVDPRDPRNAAVFDLDRAPVNARGLVEFSADMYILRPADMARSNGRLFFEVNNRGRKISSTMMMDAPADANVNDPSTLRDLGNAWMLRQGWVIAWVGWGADMAPGDGRMTVSFPIAMENGAPITERIVTVFSDRNFLGQRVFTLPLSGGPAFLSFPAVSTDRVQAQAELRVRSSDSPRPSGPEIPAGEPLSADQWSFAKCPDGGAGTPSVTDICLREGFRNDSVYELSYRATRSPVMGLGYVTSRDFVSFLRHQAQDDRGQPNPVAGLRTTICQGISSSGMYYRDYLYHGFNEDEAGRRVCDGVHIHIPGAHRLYLNYRFAQPNPFSVQHRERFVPDVMFPRLYQASTDPRTGASDAILKRPATDPLVIHTDTATEYWQFRSSLVDTDEQGGGDLAPPQSVRRYLIASTQHYPTRAAPLNYGIGNAQCQQLSNHTHPGPMARALITALVDWVERGTAPPDSRIPRIADGTLVPPDRATSAFPEIPGVAWTGHYNSSGERDFGPRVRNNAGVIDNLNPRVGARHRILVPKSDPVGNDLAGIRHPLVEVPLTTLTGWNTRRVEHTAGDLCDLVGMTVPLRRTRAERLAAGDPRPAIEELYGGFDDYLARVMRSARALVEARLMLPEDLPTIAQDAADNWLRWAQ